MQNVGYDSYNKFYRINEFAYNCISYLMDESELVWKLLKYNSSDAWNETNLTKAEKAALIYAGQDDNTLYRVFMDIGQPDAWVSEDCLIRISPYSISPDNRTVGTFTMMLEVYSHHKINTLSNYTTRVDTIMGEFLRVFNGFDIGGIGKLFFDRFGSYNDRVMPSGQTPFKGKWLLLSTKVG